MVSYTNETKIKDLPQEIILANVKDLVKSAILDYGSELKKEFYDHTVSRVSYLLFLKHKGLMIGEVKFVFETMIEHVKGKLSVSSIMQLFDSYMDSKIQKQKTEYEYREDELRGEYKKWISSPLGLAIIYKITLHEEQRMTDLEWQNMNLKELAMKIQSGEIKFNYKPDTKRKMKWQD